MHLDARRSGRFHVERGNSAPAFAIGDVATKSGRRAAAPHIAGWATLAKRRLYGGSEGF